MRPLVGPSPPVWALAVTPGSDISAQIYRSTHSLVDPTPELCSLPFEPLVYSLLAD